MPWRQEAMKDVVSCDKLTGSRKQASIREMSEWGNPARSHVAVSLWLNT